MKQRTEMTFEEAVEYNDSSHKHYTSMSDEQKQKEIDEALESWNYYLERWGRSKEETLKDLEETLMEGDNIESLDIRFEKEEDFPSRQSYEIKFNAWSERYVYVRGEYDGNTWVVAIERNPSDNLVKPIGGG